MEYKNEGPPDLQNQQTGSISAELDKINNSPEMQKIFGELDSKIGTLPMSELFDEESILPEEEEVKKADEPEEETEDEEKADEPEEDEFPELSEDESESDEEVEAKEEKKSKRSKNPYLLNKEKERALRSLQEKESQIYEMERRNQELAYQVEQLRQSEAKSWETAIVNYEHNVKNELARGRAMYELAVENGDKKAELDALEAITDAKAKLRSVENYTSQNSVYTPEPQYGNYQSQSQHPPVQQPYVPAPNYPQSYAPVPPYPNPSYPPQPYAQPPVNDYIAEAKQLVNNWFKKHNVVDEHSIYFDEEMKNKVVSYAQRYETALKKAGKENTILSEAYFNKLDGYLESEVERLREERKVKKPSTSHIGSVRGAAAPSNSRAKIDLTSEELQIINGMNGDHEKIKAEWLKQKAMQMARRTR